MGRFDDWWDNGGDRTLLRLCVWWSSFWLVALLVVAALYCFDQRWGWTIYYAALVAVHVCNLRWALRTLPETTVKS